MHPLPQSASIDDDSTLSDNSQSKSFHKLQGAKLSQHGNRVDTEKLMVIVNGYQKSKLICHKAHVKLQLNTVKCKTMRNALSKQRK